MKLAKERCAMDDPDLPLPPSGYTLDLPESIDFEAILQEQVSLQNQEPEAPSETTEQALLRLRNRIADLHRRTNNDRALARLGLAILTLESCMAKLEIKDQRVIDSPSILAIVEQVERSCQTIEDRLVKAEREQGIAPAQIASLISEIRMMAEQNTAMKDVMDQFQSAWIKRHDMDRGETRATNEKLATLLSTLRDAQIVEGRRIFASLGAVHATLERLVDRLSRVEHGMAEARSIETSVAIANWPDAVRASSRHALTELDEPRRSIDPRAALAAARAAAARAFAATETARSA